MTANTSNIDKVLAENARVMRSVRRADRDHPLNPKRVEEAVFQPNQLVQRFPQGDLDDTTLDITPSDDVIIDRFEQSAQDELALVWGHNFLDQFPHSESMRSTVEFCLMCQAPVFPSQLWCSTCDPHLPQDSLPILHSHSPTLPEYIPRSNNYISPSYVNPFDPTSDENGAFSYK